MKKLLLIAFLVFIGTSSYAYRIDVDGKGSITIDGYGNYIVNCDGTNYCCGTIEINCAVGQTPTTGDPTTIQQCEGTPNNYTIVHQWEGGYVSCEYQKNDDGSVTIQGQISNVVQDF